ncbi:MAG TPA: 3-deoxy-D-manno-octulosonic acid transferase [Methylomirabilota bacterium]|nr:3-deoxy-D-manno-octulosonic acid transferase [Methylomirabilota bacterium]
MYLLYSAALAVVLLAYLPVFLVRRLGRSGYGRAFGQRLGRLDGLPPEPRCWIHAVSVGEAAAAAPLVEGIRRRWPELSVVVSTVTPTGAQIVRDRLDGLATHRFFPLDLPGPVRRALRAVNPRFFIAMETELWPNFLRALARRGVPSMVANGRISDRSYRRYRLIRPAMARMLAHVSVFAMQSDEDARRIIGLGASPERVVVTGNLKSDLQPPDARADAIWERLLGLRPGERLWVAGSTHRGEEAIVLDVLTRLKPRVPDLALLLAPRHPERVEEVERLVRERGLSPVRRTSLPRERAAGAVIILDTVGELAECYRLADVVFVGGSLVPTGGHNMLEPALRRKPVLFGPHTSNFRESAELLQAAGAALVVKDADGLESEMARLMESEELRRRMGEAGFGAVVARQGALKQTLDLVERFLLGAGVDGTRRGGTRC